VPVRFPFLALLAVAVGSCSSTPADAPLVWQVGPGYRWRPVDPGDGKPGFTRLDPSATGITFANQLSDSAALRNQILAQGGGVAMADIDGDGRTDLFLVRTEGPSALYRNLGGFRFSEVATDAGVALGDRPATGAAFADVDGDGDQDLLVNALGGPNALFLNDGRGRFTEDSSYPGRRSQAGTTTSTLADIDGDGDLDLYQANDKAYNAKDLFTPQELAFDQAVRQTGPRQFEVVERLRKDYRVDLRDDIGGVVLVQRADPDSLYLNDGRGRFTAVPIANSARFLDEAGRPFTTPPDNFTLVARFYDLDGDGDPDLYVANDFEDPDQLWLNDGRGNFQLAPKLAQRNTSNAAMAVDMADVDRDGATDLFAVDMLSRDSRQLKTQIPTHTPLPKRPGVIDDRPQLQRNTLFLSRGDGSYAQVAEHAGVDASGWSWSTMFLDVDLDGYEDLLIGTGNRWDFMDADTQERYRNRLSDLDSRQQRMTLPRLEVPNYAFRNRGDLTFEDLSEAWGFSAGPDLSHGMAAGDLDGDGDLDVVVNRLGAPALVLRNDGGAGRIMIQLAGEAPNTAGIGARVTVTGGPVPSQSREVTAGGMYLSHSDPGLTFATGSASTVAVEVRWRDGRVSTIADAVPNRIYQIDQANATRRPSVSVGKAPAPLFADRTAELGHSHLETSVAPRQPLLPHSFSELGPGVSWLDLDSDGDDDLIIGTGSGDRLAGYRNDRGRLIPFDLGLPPADADLTSILAVPDGRGGLRLLVAQSNYESDSLATSVALPSVLGVPLDRTGRRAGPIEAAIPGDTATVGPLALADYDGDGDLDLFVGGRVIPGGYPLSPSSRLFTNDGTGRFSLDLANSAVLRSTGMVSAALFADLDGDRDPDLAYTTDWGPLKVLINTGGRFAAATETLGFTSRFGRWWGLASGDFDGDDRIDLVVTGFGTNVRPRADSTLPLYLYFGAVDDDGGLDLLLAQHDPRLGAIAPLESYATLSRAIPSLAQRVRTFAGYADLTIDQLVGDRRDRVLRLGANTSEHLIWLNRGQRFEPRPLPRDAQLAPALGPVVGDFNGDGHEDLALSQNFFPTPLNAARLDAGRSLLLFGNGSGGFEAQPGQRSGIVVYGDGRGAATADVDLDGRADLAIAQNGTATRLYTNQAAAQGIRVRLVGPGNNPWAIGAQIRARAGTTATPWREIQAGTGYWSVSSASPVIARPAGGPTTIEVRWPDGRVTTHAAAAGQTRLDLAWPVR